MSIRSLDLTALAREGTVHFVGVGGAGMCALAEMLHLQGGRVSGCDMKDSVALAMTGLDLITAISGAATALANVGPGLGDTIGPAGNFSSLNDTAKWLLATAMLVGRLEVVADLSISCI